MRWRSEILLSATIVGVTACSSEVDGVESPGNEDVECSGIPVPAMNGGDGLPVSIHSSRAFEDPQRHVFVDFGSTFNDEAPRIGARDLSGDGKVDLIVSVRNGVFALIHDATGSAGWRPVQVASALGINGSVRTAIGDVNGDGIADAMSVRPLVLQLNRGDGVPTFEAISVELDAPIAPIAFELADLDGRDGLELAALTEVQGVDGRRNPVWLFGPRPQGPAGAFVSLGTIFESYNTNQLPMASFDADDVDGDGRADLILGPAIAFNAADEMFGFGTPRAAPLGALIDVNGDGRKDVLRMKSWQPLNALRIEILTQDAERQWTDSKVFALWLGEISSVSSFAGGDINGDGLNDLVAIGGTDVLVFLQDSSSPGSFVLEGVLSPPLVPLNEVMSPRLRTLLLVDVDEDQAADLVVVEPDAITIHRARKGRLVHSECRLPKGSTEP